MVGLALGLRLTCIGMINYIILCVGVALGLRWGCVGVALGLRWGCVGVALGLHWGCVGVALGLCLPFFILFFY